MLYIPFRYGGDTKEIPTTYEGGTLQILYGSERMLSCRFFSW
jgi:hypothetical protein